MKQLLPRPPGAKLTKIGPIRLRKGVAPIPPGAHRQYFNIEYDEDGRPLPLRLPVTPDDEQGKP